MENDDFSFHPVGASVGQDGCDTQKLVENVGGIKLEDQVADGVSNSQDNGIVRNDELVTSDAKRKQGQVGSLSFIVTDLSAAKNANGSTGRKVVEDTGGSSGKVVEDRKISVKKAAPRSKVPFEKGYSQMDWMKLTRTHPDLAGLKGQSNRRLITLSEVKQHQTEGSMWTVLRGRVYNIAPYMKFHPGGVDMLMKAVGKDCTSLFNKYHSWVNADILLEKCLVGILDDGK